MSIVVDCQRIEIQDVFALLKRNRVIISTFQLSNAIHRCEATLVSAAFRRVSVTPQAAGFQMAIIDLCRIEGTMMYRRGTRTAPLLSDLNRAKPCESGLPNQPSFY
jgi:hypothetical protein